MKRTPIRYFGGKFRISSWIISYFPNHRIYCEPFGGGGSVLFNKQPCYQDVYNDLDGEMVNLFEVLRDHGEDLARSIELTPFSKVEHDQAYQNTSDKIEQARRTLIKSHMSFGSNGIQSKSGFRRNVHRSYTTPAHDWGCLAPVILEAMNNIRGIIIDQMPAIDCIENYDSKETLFYIDPPYHHETRGRSDRYRNEMSEDDHVNLLLLLNSVEGMVVLSGYRHKSYEQLLSNWKLEIKKVNDQVGNVREECLWLNEAVMKNSYIQKELW